MAENTQVYWVTAMEAARRAPAEALVRGNIGLTPARSTFGAFSVREEIRREIGEMFGKQQRRDKRKNQGSTVHSSVEDDKVGHGASGLTESDRRRKPD